MITEKNSTVGQRFKQFRLEKGLSQMEVTEGICSYSVVSQLENGRNIPSAKILGKLAERLGVPLKEIMGVQEKQLEAGFQIDMIRVYIESGDHKHALELAIELEERDDLLEYQRRELILSKADCLIWTQSPNEAISLLSQLQEELEMIKAQDDHLMARIFNMIGFASFLTTDTLGAFSNYKRAYEVSLRFPEFNQLAAEISYNLGYVCNETGYHREAVTYLDRARKFFDQADNVKKLAQTVFSSALAYKNIGQLAIAEEYLKQALVLYEAEKCFRLASIVRQQRAFYVTSASDPEEAIRELETCREEFIQLEDFSLAVYTDARIAMLCIELGHMRKAEFFLKDGEVLIASKQLVEDTKIAYFYHIYSKYHLVTEQFNVCIDLAEKSSQIFAIMGLSKESAKSLDVSAEAYERDGEVQKALNTLKKIKQILLSLDGGIRV